MAELRSLCEADLGWGGVETYIQSGNVIFEAGGAPAKLEGDLERGVESRFGYQIAVLVRAAADWPGSVCNAPSRVAGGVGAPVACSVLLRGALEQALEPLREQEAARSGGPVSAPGPSVLRFLGVPLVLGALAVASEAVAALVA